MYLMSSAAGGGIELNRNNYPYKTWIVVEPNGPEFLLTAYGRAKPITQMVGPTGVTGGYNACDLNSRITWGTVTSFFGSCGGNWKADSSERSGQIFIRMGSFPLSYTTPDNNECPPKQTPEVCHVQEVTEISFTVFPIPVTLRPVKASHRAVPFDAVSYKKVTFTIGAIPDTLLIKSLKRAMPVTTTSWVYTAGDGALDGNMCPVPFPILGCSPDLHKAGRMVIKAFVGGWEQTTSITVQCLVTPNEPALNDSTTDYQVREEMVDMLRRSHADSSSTAGWNASNPVGWRHETSISVWRTGLNSFRALPHDRPTNTACSNRPGDDGGTVGPPGSTFYAWGHDHVTPPGQAMFCAEAGKSVYRGKEVQLARFPGDRDVTGALRPVRVKAKGEGGSYAGSGADWEMVKNNGRTHFIMAHDGRVYRLNPWQGPPHAKSWDSYRAFGGTAAQNKCTWVKKAMV